LGSRPRSSGQYGAHRSGTSTRRRMAVSDALDSDALDDQFVLVLTPRPVPRHRVLQPAIAERDSRQVEMISRIGSQADEETACELVTRAPPWHNQHLHGWSATAHFDMS
jgi:hypothetical protein